jgi:predicted DNA-binding antitoxin AbrB/MazE fold protein
MCNWCNITSHIVLVRRKRKIVGVLKNKQELDLKNGNETILYTRNMNENENVLGMKRKSDVLGTIIRI